MASVGSTSAVENVTVTQSNTTATIYNVTATNANTEYSQALPSNAKGFIIKSRSISKMRLAYSSGGTATQWVTIPAGCSYEDLHFYASQTIYFQSDVAGVTVEIVAFN